VAQKVQILLIDDIDGSDAEGTVRFGLDGTSYEIDLNAAHAAELRAALATFITAGRKIPAAGSRQAGRAGRRAAGRGAETMQVREWAKSQGIEIKDRGRVPARIIAQYREATGK
jgi:hypothetical protein